MTYTPCGGCGAEKPSDRCINCHHDFGGRSVSLPYPNVQAMGPGTKLPHCRPVRAAEPLPKSTIDWMRYFMGFARHAATKSKDSTQVGAILVGPAGEVRLTAFNGPPRGVNDLAQRRERPAKYLYASHAEANLIAFAAREGIRTKGCIVYSTHQPCAACARTLIQAGVLKVVYETSSFGPGSPYAAEMEAAETMFREAGIVCEALS